MPGTTIYFIDTGRGDPAGRRDNASHTNQEHSRLPASRVVLAERGNAV